jgi:Winged helix DNA-binding domain
MLRTTWRHIAALRLRRQRLETRAPAAAMLEVVRDHVAIQAQVMSSAELTLNSRLDGLAPGAVSGALWRHRTLVKTWAMRGTLHLVAASELPELVRGLGTRLNWLSDVWLRYFGVSRDEMIALQAAIGDVLTDQPMTRAELAAHLADRLGNPAFVDRVSSGWGTFLKPAASLGRLAFGPDRGRNVTFVHPAAWLAIEIPQPADDGLDELIHRHLGAFPGSSKGELARWAGVQRGSINRSIARLRERVEEVDVDDTMAWARAEDVREIAAIEPATAVRLLGGFDPYTLSLQKEAEPLLPAARRSLVSRQAGWISAVLLVGGAVQGTWTHDATAKRLRVRVEPWRRLTKAERRAVEAEVSRVARYVAAGIPLELEVSDPV